MTYEERLIKTLDKVVRPGYHFVYTRSDSRIPLFEVRLYKIEYVRRFLKLKAHRKRKYITMGTFFIDFPDSWSHKARKMMDFVS